MSLWSKIKVWFPVVLGAIALFLLFQWARARDMLKRTKEQLEASRAETRQQAEMAKQERELKQKHDAINASLEESLAEIEMQRRQQLDTERHERHEREEAASDIDKAIELGRKKRQEGKLR